VPERSGGYQYKMGKNTKLAKLPFRRFTSSSDVQEFRNGKNTKLEFLAKFRQNVARFRLYRHRFLQANTRFAAFFKVYQIFKRQFLKFGKILQKFRHLQNFC
jgi:hypothetical protein